MIILAVTVKRKRNTTYPASGRGWLVMAMFQISKSWQFLSLLNFSDWDYAPPQKKHIVKRISVDKIAKPVTLEDEKKQQPLEKETPK